VSRKLTLLISFLLITAFVVGQTGKIAGKVLNQKNEPIVGASIKIALLSSGTATDVEGRFLLTLPAGKKYEITISAIGYETKTISEIEIEAGKVNELSFSLDVTSKKMSEVTVTAARNSARKETVASIIQFQRNTNTVASVISAESIRRSPDRNTGEVLKRTPGASLQDGKFLVVRGLADRYNQAMLNGILLTSTEPDRKTFSFDLIPAAMIDNIVINKAFVPEYPGEWAGGLIQVNTKDIPSQNFFNVQIGTGFNTQTIGRKFYKDQGGNLDWLGIDDGARALPEGYKTKSQFDEITPAEKTQVGKSLPNRWVATETRAPLNVSFQANGGFSSKLLSKTLGGTFGINYNKTNRYTKLLNRYNTLSGNNFSINYNYNDDRYSQEVAAGALGSLTLQIDPRNKVSLRSIINVNTTNAVTERNGIEIVRGEDIKGSELGFKENTFFTAQASGDHSIASAFKLKWYSSFSILDGYIPDQRRTLYSRTLGTANPYSAVISNSLSQQSGSRVYQLLNDYIYTAGGDVSYNFNLFNQKQTVKGGYMFQVKDRLFDAILFANYLPKDNPSIRQLPADQIFAPQNFGDGSVSSSLFAFDAIKGNTFRYLANTILNAGFLQLDNQFSNALRVVWGLRVEDYDQLVGSVKKSDPRHLNTRVTDFLPGVNATYKLNAKTNFRLSGSQTVIRPELRELAFLNIYDFELNASVQGKPSLERTKATNADLRYEIYPRGGEVFTLGVFYKSFDKPIEQLYSEGSGGASTFFFDNPEKATSYGAEVEFRKRLDVISGGLQNFTFQANAAYIYSRVKDFGKNLDRPMQGQSPYLVNVSLMYDLQEKGFSTTLLYNQIGERIYLVGDISAGAGTPDIYEASRPVLDFQVAQKIINKKGELRLNVSDIFNKVQNFYQNNRDGKKTYQNNNDALRFTRKYGTTFGLTFNYSF
jgi:TonB-dependent receptor